MRYLRVVRGGVMVAVVGAACGLIGWAQPSGSSSEIVSAPLLAAGAIMPALSPDGGQLAVSYQGAIWRLPSEGGAMRRLSRGGGFDIQPAWSPDGTRIAFARGRDFGGGPLQVIRADDGTAVEIPASPPIRGPMFFDSKGERILAAFLDEGGKSQRLAWFELASGQLSEPVYQLQMRQKFALSHDRKTIVATATRDVPTEQAGNFGPVTTLWRVSAEGGEPERLGEWPSRVHELCFTADNQGLIIATDWGGAHNDLWQLPLADLEKGAKRLTFGSADETTPTVSTDGRLLFFTDNAPGPTTLVRHELLTGRSMQLETTQLDFGEATGRLELNIVDDATGKPVTARCSVQHDDGKFHMAPGTLYRLRGELHSYVNGSTQYTLPAGRYQIKVYRGPEYRLVRLSCVVPIDGTKMQTVRMERWTDQRALGWYSGDSHIHANYGYGQWFNSPQTMQAQCSGEDLAVANLMVANSDNDSVFDRQYFRGRPDPLSTAETVLYWNEEYRSTIWGHMTLLNLQQLVDPIYTGFEFTNHPHDHPTNADAGLATHDQHGHVNYTHPASNVKDPYDGPYSAKGLPIDVALGAVDSIDVMGMSSRENLPLWYRLLNCGFRLSASAGTDCFLNRVNSTLPGGDRVYVQVDGAFSYAKWIDGLKAGRTFVTNGPMLDLAVDKKMPGETLPLKAPGEVHVTARVRSEQPLDRIELVQNGEVVATMEIKKSGTDVQFEQTVPIKTGGWMALRVSGPPHPLATRGESFAHTSPVYLEVAGAPPDASADAQYFLTWIDRLWETVRRRNRIPDRHHVEVETQIANARAAYLRLIKP